MSQTQLSSEELKFSFIFLLCLRNPNIQSSEKPQSTIQEAFEIKGCFSMKKNKVLIQSIAAQNAEKEKKEESYGSVFLLV